jgi:hypothetical protein
MTDNDPTSERPSGDDFREVFDLVDETVDAISDEHVDAQLGKLLAQHGYATPSRSQNLEVFQDDDLMSPDPEIQAATTLFYTRRKAAAELERAARLSMLADEAEQRRSAAVQSMDAYVETALDRAQEILDDALEAARCIVNDAQRRATDMTQRARRAVDSDSMPASGRVGWADVPSAWYNVLIFVGNEGRHRMVLADGVWTDLQAARRAAQGWNVEELASSARCPHKVTVHQVSSWALREFGIDHPPSDGESVTGPPVGSGAGRVTSPAAVRSPNLVSLGDPLRGLVPGSAARIQAEEDTSMDRDDHSAKVAS